jgi:hypothetical protein
MHSFKYDIRSLKNRLEEFEVLLEVKVSESHFGYGAGVEVVV